jgi:hypothetical protein
MLFQSGFGRPFAAVSALQAALMAENLATTYALFTVLGQVGRFTIDTNNKKLTFG